jgi:nicotinate-nucleotide pyrophosphorylase (carboxylating)
MAVRQLEDVERDAITRVVEQALAEDLGDGDVTSLGTVPEDATCTARVVVKETGIVAGIPVVRAVFETLDPTLAVDEVAADGDRSAPLPYEVVRIAGSARSVLAGERVALNLLGRLSGIATATQAYVDAVAGTGATILDTRKTTPGLRALEKYAVRCGGGSNHRFGLDDGILVKDNHLLVAGSVTAAVRGLRQISDLPIEVEVETLDELREALAARVDRVLLDNMAPPLLREAVALCRGRASTEASGGITLATVREVAESRVDFISIGALTHSVRSLDVSLEVVL